jgi:hypothetical protein
MVLVTWDKDKDNKEKNIQRNKRKCRDRQKGEGCPFYAPSSVSRRATCLHKARKRDGLVTGANVCEGRETYLSRMASCQRCNFATSFTWKPKIRGRYRSARSATVAVLIVSPRPSAPSTSSSRTRAPLRRGSSAVVAPALGAMPTAPRAGSADPLLGGRRAGYTRKSRCGKEVPK